MGGVRKGTRRRYGRDGIGGALDHVSRSGLQGPFTRSCGTPFRSVFRIATKAAVGKNCAYERFITEMVDRR